MIVYLMFALLGATEADVKGEYDTMSDCMKAASTLNQAEPEALELKITSKQGYWFCITSVPPKGRDI